MTERLDAALAARGLARSRSHAARLIADGRVQVNGRVSTKASLQITSNAQVQVTTTDHYVSRGAHKLIAALDAFAVAVSGRLALDLGASTGGFTQVLRERGARAVIAVDVGHDQLHASVAADPGVIAASGVNVRYLTAESLAGISGADTRPDLITADLSFISLRYVLPAIAAVAAPQTDILVLIKPQFEVGRTAVARGLVTDPRQHAASIRGVVTAAAETGIVTRGLVASPRLGVHGNREFLAYLTPGPVSDPTEWWGTIDEVVGGV